MSLLDATKFATGSGATTAVLEPATGDQLGEFGLATPQDIEQAAGRAAAAQRDWARTPYSERAAVLRRAGDLFAEHAAEIEDWIVRESGAIGPKAQLETHIAQEECYEAATLPSRPSGELLATEKPRLSIARRLPAGVVGVIAPFNFPLILSIRSVAPALALGNAVVLKPDPRTAVCGGVVVARIFEEAGLPDGVLHVLPGGADAGQALVMAPPVRVISFTGSAAAFGSFIHQGQVCMTTGRHIVHESVADEYAERLAEKANHLPVGDPAREQVALGPIIDAGQRDRIHQLVTASRDAGATIAAGGDYDGLFYKATVVTDVTPSTPVWAEEVFGPVAPITRFATTEEAVRIATETDYGLSLGILSRDVMKAYALAEQIPSGLVHINDQTVDDEATAPFGGVGASGTGSRLGGAAANVDAFTETQWLTIQGEISPYPF